MLGQPELLTANLNRYILVYIMNITQTLQKWGNSAGVRLPKKVIEAAHLQLNDPLEVTIKGKSIILTPAKKKPPITLQALLSGVKPEDVSGEYNWGEPAGKELW